MVLNINFVGKLTPKEFIISINSSSITTEEDLQEEKESTFKFFDVKVCVALFICIA